MSGPKRNPDKLNTIGVVVVGICGAVLVYVTIVALQAFYMDDTSEIQTMADYGGQDTFAKAIRSTQEGAIKEYAPNGAVADPKQQTYRIAIEQAMKKVAVEAKKDPSNLVPMVGKSDAPTVLPVFGRPKAIPGAAPPAGAGSGSAAPAPTGGSAAPMTPTGGIGAGGNPPPGNEGNATNPGTGNPTPAGSAAPTGTGSAAPAPKPPAAKPPAKPPAKPRPAAGSGSNRPPAKGNAP